MCGNGGHTFKGGPALGKNCDCGQMKLEKTLTLDKKGNPMAKIVPTGVLDQSLGSVLERGFEKIHGRKNKFA